MIVLLFLDIRDQDNLLKNLTINSTLWCLLPPMQLFPMQDWLMNLDSWMWIGRLFSTKSMEIFLVWVMLSTHQPPRPSTEDCLRLQLWGTTSKETSITCPLMPNTMDIPRRTSLWVRATSSVLSINMMAKRSLFQLTESAQPLETCCKESMTPKIYSNSRTGVLPTINSKSPSTEAKPP